MFFSVLTTLLLAVSSVMANQSQQAWGPMRANLGRLLLAFVALGGWALCFGGGVSGAGFGQFFLSGALGIGIGDMAFFATLPLLGSRLTTVMMQCLAVPTAIVVEWLWLDTRLSPAQLACTGVVLAGIIIALLPTKKDPPKVRVKLSGVFFGLIAAVGQGLGAVFSRRGFAITNASGHLIDGFTAAFQRNLGGLGLTVAFFVIWRLVQRRSNESAPAITGKSYGWMLGNALAGPIFGMGTMQLALSTTPSGIVLPIMATTPLLVIPVAYWIEHERPTKRSLAGGIVAVGGAVALTLV